MTQNIKLILNEESDHLKLVIAISFGENSVNRIISRV